MTSSLALVNVNVLITGSRLTICNHSETLVILSAKKVFLSVALQDQFLKQPKYSSSSKVGKMIKPRELSLFSKTVSEITSLNSWAKNGALRTNSLIMTNSKKKDILSMESNCLILNSLKLRLLRILLLAKLRSCLKKEPESFPSELVAKLLELFFPKNSYN